MRIAIAIHDPPVWTIPSSQVARIVRSLPRDHVVDARDPGSRLRAFAAADVLFATRISATEYAAARNLRWIHSSAVGVGGLLPPDVVAGDVLISNSRGVHSEAIAEHAIALVLALRRRLHTAVRRQVDGHWAQVELQRSGDLTLAQTHVLVIGLGTIGARVAELAAALGMHVTGVRKRLEFGMPHGVTDILPAERLNEALRVADVVILALPRVEGRRALIGREELELMKRTALLINVSRGHLIDEPALADALASGRIAGAGLDAFCEEPPPQDHPFWRLPNLLLTPHTASFAGDYWPPVVDLFLENVERFRSGEPLVNVVDKALGY